MLSGIYLSAYNICKKILNAFWRKQNIANTLGGIMLWNIDQNKLKDSHTYLGKKTPYNIIIYPLPPIKNIFTADFTLTGLLMLQERVSSKPCWMISNL